MTERTRVWLPCNFSGGDPCVKCEGEGHLHYSMLPTFSSPASTAWCSQSSSLAPWSGLSQWKLKSVTLLWGLPIRRFQATETERGFPVKGFTRGSGKSAASIPDLVLNESAHLAATLRGTSQISEPSYWAGTLPDLALTQGCSSVGVPVARPRSLLISPSPTLNLSLLFNVQACSFHSQYKNILHNYCWHLECVPLE